MKDLISRQAAIDSLRMDVDMIPFNRAKAYVREAIETVGNRLEQLPSAEPNSDRYEQGIIEGRVQMRTELLTKLKEMVGEEIWTNI